MKGYLRLLGGQRIQSPRGLITRPTTSRVREAVMNLLGKRIENSNWLDLFSGSGSMSCEALRRGAINILAIEKDKKIAEICKANIRSVAKGINQKSDIKVICQEVVNFLKEGREKHFNNENLSSCFDLVYLDPPYDSKIYQSVLKNLLIGNWLRKNALVICEHSSSVALEAPESWDEQDRRVYGSSALLVVTPQSPHHLADIDSRPTPRGL